MAQCVSKTVISAAPHILWQKILDTQENVSYIADDQKQVVIKKMNLEGDILTIKVDVSKEFGPSASGKTIIIAATEGNVSIPGSEEKKIGLNI